MDYAITTPDANEPGVTAAREAYNAALPPTVDDGAGGQKPNPDLKADNAAYMTWVMVKATESYCIQYGITV